MSVDTPTRVRQFAVSSLCAGVVAGGVAAVAPTPAFAESVKVADPSGDPVQDPDSDEYLPAPGAKAVDLLTTRFDYRDQVLVVRGTARRARPDVQQFVRVKSGGRSSFFFTVGRDVVGEDECRGASARVNRSTATYTVKIPAACFGTPSTVRVGLALTRYSRAMFTIDDAQREGFSSRNDEPRLGRALRRG